MALMQIAEAPAGVSASFLWLAATAGALSLLTPCVFPMVPITVSYFVRHAGMSRARAFSAVAVFGLGIVATFTLLGVGIAVLAGAAGLARFAANPYVNLVIAAIFIALALNLMGVYELRLPGGLLTRLDAATRDEQGGASEATRALLMGVLFTLTSFTCTAPFIGTLLVAASQGEWQRPIAGMLVYAAVFALPFVALATVPRWIGSLPRGGAWLGRLKAVMGFIELAAAVKFLSNADLVWGWNVFTHDVVLAIWVVIALVITFYLLGAFRLPHEPSEPRASLANGARSPLPKIHPARGIGALAFLALGMWLVTGLTGRPLGTLESFLPPVGGLPPVVNAAGVPAELPWHLNDLPAALALARAEHRNVFIDFTGYTCTNCRWMEANMFSRPEVKAAMNRFVLARLYTDGDGEMYERQQEFQQRQFGTIALPLYAIVDANGKTVKTFAGLTRSPNAFLSVLASGHAD
jgi:thiol:disulfide interchange protein DsbD